MFKMKVINTYKIYSFDEFGAESLLCTVEAKSKKDAYNVAKKQTNIGIKHYSDAIMIEK